MESLDYWRLCDQLSVAHAALLLAGHDPSREGGYAENRPISKRPENYEAAKAAISNALLTGTIEGSLVPEHDLARLPPAVEGSVDIMKSTVNVESLRTWLQGRGFTSGFFFPTSPQVPPYLDPNNSYYSSKLAAAVRAWEAVTTDPIYLDNGKHVKQNLTTWLTAHAAELELLKSDGDINTDAIENQVAKVANWQDKGGAPKTPGG